MFARAACWLVAAATLLVHPVLGFSFNVSTPTQCGPLTVQWDGGTGPFHLILVPTVEFNVGRIWNISIPSSMTGAGSYTFDLVQPGGLTFLATMYDSTGFGAGGTTPVLTVGSSSNSSCLSNDLNYDFTFSTSPQSNPGQCSDMQLNWNSNVSYPLQLLGLIPSGSAFSIPVPQNSGQTSTTWTVNIAQGTQFLLLMADNGQYQTGGSTNLLTVGGGSSSCLNSSSPSTGGSSGTTASSGGGGGGSPTATSSAPSQSVSGVGGGSSGGTNTGVDTGSGGSNRSSINVGAIVGGVLGGVALLLLLFLLAFFCIRRRTGSRRSSDGSPDDSIRNYGVGEKPRRHLDILGGVGGMRRSSSDELSHHGRPMEVSGDLYQPSPFRYPSPPNTPGTTHPHTPGSNGYGVGAATPTSALHVPPPLIPGAAAAEKERMAFPGNSRYSSYRSDRPSDDSQRMPDTPSTNPAQGYTLDQIQAQNNWSNSDSSNVAAVGHQQAPSLRKSASANSLRGSSRRHSRIYADASGEEEELEPQERERRFVQHQDAGSVVDLPPRYDQLRARNPDPVTQ